MEIRQAGTMYFMYSDEIEIYEQIGLEKFWQHPDFDNYSVNRKRITDSFKKI